MATTPIPNPMMNPTGTYGSGNFNGAGMFSTSSGFTQPATGGPGNYGFGNGMNPSAAFSPSATTPTATPAASPTTSPTPQQSSTGSPSVGGFIQPYQDQGGMAISSANNPMGMTEGQQYWQLDYLQKAFGPMGPMIYQYLNSMGGYNSQVTQQSIDAQTNAMGKQTQLGANQIESSLSSMGVSGSSSGMADALTGYENQATQQENAITAQEYYNMWQTSQANELNVMEFAADATGKVKANAPTTLDYIGLGEQAGSTAIQGISSLMAAAG
jgi:hypothetical protein